MERRISEYAEAWFREQQDEDATATPSSRTRLRCLTGRRARQVSSSLKPELQALELYNSSTRAPTVLEHALGRLNKSGIEFQGLCLLAECRQTWLVLPEGRPAGLKLKGIRARLRAARGIARNCSEWDVWHATRLQ